MNRLTIINSFKAKPWNSRLQLTLGGAMIYLMAVYLGPYYGCGAGMTNTRGSTFSCLSGDMPGALKLMVLMAIVFASLCWGRAMALYEKSRDKQRPAND